MIRLTFLFDKIDNEPHKPGKNLRNVLVGRLTFKFMKQTQKYQSGNKISIKHVFINHNFFLSQLKHKCLRESK